MKAFYVSPLLAVCFACRSLGVPGPLVLALDEGPLHSRPQTVAAGCERALKHASGVRESIRAVRVEDARQGSVLVPYDHMIGTLHNAGGVMSLLANVHPDETVREAAEACERDLQALSSAIDLDPGLFARLRALREDELDPEARWFRAKVLERLLIGGVDRSEDVRARLGVLQEEMLSVGQSFQRNIRDDVRHVEVEPASLAGLPADFVTAHPVNERGMIVLDTNHPDFFPIQTYAERAEVREALMRAFSSRGHPANRPVLERLLALRHEYATRLGHRSWADLQAKDKMVGSAARIRSFTEEVAELARPRMQRDLETLLAEKRRLDAAAVRIEKWDRLFLLRELQRRNRQYDPAEARNYFGYERVLAGAFDVFGSLFELEFVPTNRPVWHPSVRSFDLRLRGELVGRFFLDMFPRDGKYGHAAMFPITAGRRGAELSEAALVCNFPDPSRGPALLEHGQVVTFFHELGHLIHHLLARNANFVNQAGISTEWDFVEAPSQLLEEWAFDPQVLARFARHHETGAPMPSELINRMRAARDDGLGVHVMRQLFYQALSLELHDQDPSALDVSAVSQALERRFAPYPPVEGTHEYASFGHLEGYSSMYYTYQWSLALAKDLLTGFTSEGLLSAEVARRYRDRVLSAGGTKPAAELMADFLGRGSSLDAYRRWLTGS